jgi:superfamily II DNA or RNA helicase
MGNGHTSFITNEEGNKLSDKLEKLLKSSKSFDCLVGYFVKSGFHQIYKSLEDTKKIRILVGIGTDKTIQNLSSQKEYQTEKEVRTTYMRKVQDEFENPDTKDSLEVKNSVEKMKEWISSGKLEIRAYREKLHSKIYIMSYDEEKVGGTSIGSVITGSSNLSKAGLDKNLEFNVQLNRPEDYKFALNKFEELWRDSIPVSKDFIITINNTWINNNISPYELYIKFLYEYFKDKVDIDQKYFDEESFDKDFMKLQYQKDAVVEAKAKLEEFGGVFLSDVVGLGKTYISALLIKELGGKTLVIAPPNLLDEASPGSWKNVFYNLRVPGTKYESIGKLDSALRKAKHFNFDTVIIDESHRFRTESTEMYRKLWKICRGRKVILVSATPMNNSPYDILSQIKLFQKPKNSTLPDPKVKNLINYFAKLESKKNKLNRVDNNEEYLKVIRENAKSIREDILNHLMVRRTRRDVEKYYKKDLNKQGLKFPEVENPIPLIYRFDKKTDKLFNETLKLIIKELKYSRYTPMKYYTGKTELAGSVRVAMAKLIMILLLKRLESSFFAFKKTIERFIKFYENFIKQYDLGRVYVSKKYAQKFLEFAEGGDLDSIEKLIDEGKGEKYSSKEFSKDFKKDLERDLEILKKLKSMWDEQKDDPKIDELNNKLKKDGVLKKHKLIIFSESEETTKYLENNLQTNGNIMAYSAKSSEKDRNRIIDNFDPNSKNKKDDIKILITTDVLSEGVNLNRSNVVINYDIPWNPTKLMQRVGRINRVSKNLPFDKIYTYNFFPADPVEDTIQLKSAAKSKIAAFIEMLGNDAMLLTNEEIKGHDLFLKLNSKEFIIGENEEDPELKYLTFLRKVRDEDKEFYSRVKKLPKKARTAKLNKGGNEGVLTFFRKGKLMKILLAMQNSIEELDFVKAIEFFETNKNIKREKLDFKFYELLEKNKEEFSELFTRNMNVKKVSKGNELQLVKEIKAIINKGKNIENFDKDYLIDVLNLLKEGEVDKGTIKIVLKLIKQSKDPFKKLEKIRSEITEEFFIEPAGSKALKDGPKEVILSEYLIKK